MSGAVVESGKALFQCSDASFVVVQAGRFVDGGQRVSHERPGPVYRDGQTLGHQFAVGAHGRGLRVATAVLFVDRRELATGLASTPPTGPRAGRPPGVPGRAVPARWWPGWGACSPA